ncbi:MAG: J domain-containing protein [Prosthecobacter sp.]|uniref:DnaJ C-terminal domain-containing protein n=1 Tax=Prosthecobacter sp. TaxID=1965333 RepID=UPI003BB0B29E
MPAEFKDYYATLGVARDASADEIKKAFRKLARLYHPDTAKDKKTAEAKFKEINEANEVLSDPEKRRKYDTLGANWQDEGNFRPPPQGAGSHEQEFHFGGTGFSDFFEQYFSGGSRYGFPQGFEEEIPTGAAKKGRARRGHDIEGDILVTLEEAMHGTQRPISLQTVNRQTGAVQTHSFEVRIPPGATDGRRIRVPGQGEPGQNGGQAGDLYLRVRHAAHPEFTTEEADVHHDLDLAPWEAVLGAEVIVPTLDGSIKLRVPAGSENGQSLRVRGRGLPKGKSAERGDFFVKLQIVLPTKLSDAERTLWEQLRSASTFNPRA